jgi:hypothetical protein
MDTGSGGLSSDGLRQDTEERGHQNETKGITQTATEGAQPIILAQGSRNPRYASGDRKCMRAMA